MEKQTNEKKVLIFSTIAVVLLIIVVVGATYAFFTAQGGASANTNVNVQTNTTDNLSFSVGEPISITANQDNFAEGLGNQAGSTTASATLTANNATNSATANYYLYLDITNNDFEYTVDTNTPELILTIIDPDGTELTNLSGYQYVEVGDVSGFDITTVSDVIKIADNYEITSAGTETQTWNITVTFVNLDTDQVGNTGKNFNASLIIQEEQMNIPVNLASYITDSLYTTDGENGLYYHDGQGEYVNSDQEAGDNSYRYSGDNPNNYVCFGSDEASCPADNLYRIIGVFDGKVKVIKSDYAGESTLGMAPTGTIDSSSYSYYKGNLRELPYYYWSGSSESSSNEWRSSTLNTEILNGSYLTILESNWSNLISNHTWQIGGNIYQNIYSVSVRQTYENEIENPATNITYENQVGIMYISDYGYAASPDNWTTILRNYDTDINRNNNWMFMGVNEWTISRTSDTSDLIFGIDYTGYVGNNYANIYQGSIRPVFYLNSDVQIYEGHSGTQSDPYRIVL